MGKEKPIIQQIKERKWKWIGHILRKDWIGHILRKDSRPIERQALNRNPQGCHNRGRTKRTWRRTVEEDIGKVGKTWKEVVALA
jgi:hypothetical protein